MAYKRNDTKDLAALRRAKAHAQSITEFWARQGLDPEARVMREQGLAGAPNEWCVRTNMRNGVPTKKIKR